MERIYVCIDLKSFYASVECIERGLDPLNTNLIVADSTRTEKTICLAITPTLKQYGLSGRSRLFEVIKKVKNVNLQRKKENNYRKFTSKSYLDSELKKNKSLELDYIVAPPQMKKYMKYSTDIYTVYLKYLAPEDIYAYSIDEVFCDITNYIKYYKMTPKELVTKMIRDVYETTGITATAGIGTNMFLAKVCMDIVAKHCEANEIGVRIAEIDQQNYRKFLWNHRPITDFWRVGLGIAKKLEQNKIYTMGDIARCSIENENLLYKLFGVNAELLIDHAWGYEPTTIEEVKKYKPKKNSISSGQVLKSPYNYEKTKLIVREMIELLSLDMVARHIVTNQLVLTIGYDIENLTNPSIRRRYSGEIITDNYGRQIPKSSHGTINLEYRTSSTQILTKKCIELFDNIINKNLLVRRINIAVLNIVDEKFAKNDKVYKQLDLFSDCIDEISQKKMEKEFQENELRLQRTLISIKNKYGKNAILKAMNLEEGATTIDRNKQVGGHKG
ncbi:MAG: DNA methylase [bacterium]|nr:DNA methylase [bacterium]